MDLSIKLKLDDSGLAGQAQAAAGQVAAAVAQVKPPDLAADAAPLRAAAAEAQGLAAATAQVRPPDLAADAAPLKAAKAAADDLAAAAKQLGDEAKAASGGVSDAATAAAKLAEEAKKAGEAAKDAGEKAKQAGRDAADGSKEAEAGMKGLDSAVAKARGGMGVLNGAVAMSSGSLQGMAGGAVQAANGMRLLGASMQTAMMATGVLAAIAAAVATVTAACGAAAEQAQRLADQRFEGIQGAVERLSQTFSDMRGEIARTLDLANQLEAVDADGRRIERERKLAEIERDRARAIAEVRAGGGDEAAVNKRFDERRRAVEFEGMRSENADTVAELERKLAANQEAQKVARADFDNLRSQRSAHLDAAREEQEKADGAFLGIGRGRHRAEADRHREAASGLDGGIRDRLTEMRRLEDEATVLRKTIGKEKGRAAVIDIKEQAATAAANIPPPPKKDESGGGVKDHATRGGGFGSMQMASDRLARIGGFVGGSYSRQNEAREQIHLDREKLAVLKNIDENTKNKESGGLA